MSVPVESERLALGMWTVSPHLPHIRHSLAWCLVRPKGTRNCIYWEMASRFSRILHFWSVSGYTLMRQRWLSSGVLFPQVQYSSKWSISPSRCGGHQQYFGMDWRIYHVLPPHMGVNTTNLPLSSAGNAAIFHLVENRIVPDVPVSIR